MDEKMNGPQPCENRARDGVDPAADAERREEGRPAALCQKPSPGQQRPRSDEEACKARLVEEACQARDCATLSQLAVSEHGLVLDRLRRIACELSAKARLQESC